MQVIPWVKLQFLKPEAQPRFAETKKAQLSSLMGKPLHEESEDLAFSRATVAHFCKSYNCVGAFRFRNSTGSVKKRLGLSGAGWKAGLQDNANG
jgi:hypothetical protein